jgi:hypothetical protein
MNHVKSTHQIVAGMLDNSRQMKHQELERVAVRLGYLVHSGEQRLRLQLRIFELYSLVSCVLRIQR